MTTGTYSRWCLPPTEDPSPCDFFSLGCTAPPATWAKYCAAACEKYSSVSGCSAALGAGAGVGGGGGAGFEGTAARSGALAAGRFTRAVGTTVFLAGTGGTA